MESQDAVAEKKPLFTKVSEDIPSIDDEDTSSSTGENVTVIARMPLSSTDDDEDKIGNYKNQQRGKDGNLPDIGKLSDSLADKNECDKDKMEKEDEYMCIDGKSLSSLHSYSVLDGTCHPPSECVTHSISFAIQPKGIRKDSVPSSETVAHASGGKMSDTHATLFMHESSGSKPKTKLKKNKKAATKTSRDLDSSVVSTKKQRSPKTTVKSKFTPGSFEYIQEKLNGCIFSGWVEERKWVEHLAGYRDVIEVDEWEEEMNHALTAIIRSIPGVEDGTKWINMTPPGFNCPCYCVWSLLSTPPAPGHYWFAVTGVALQPQFGLKVTLKIIRSIHPHDGEVAAARRKRRKELALRGPGHEFESMTAQVQDWLEQLKLIDLSVVLATLGSAFTLSNMRDTIRFVIVLCMTLVVGLVTLIRETHHNLLQLIHTVSVFFHNVTPLLQSVLAFVEKIIGGIFLLIAMVYKDFRRPSPPPVTSLPPATQPPFAIGFSSPPSPTSAAGPRMVKYVPPEQWVYRNQER
ncbi:hypothetical protein SK128_026456 [Halocaridina rubra]|uniref:Uncharacterized protein n=1 Tax=Halocaridina rubra TaxID=373956 RepID=A0AAN8XCL7_HALRR